MASAPAQSSAVARLKDRLYDVNALHMAAGVMDWDQQVNMPPGGGAARAEHLGILARMSHELFTDEATAKLLDAASAEAATAEDKALVRVTKRDYDLATKLPASLVAMKSREGTLAHEVWVNARKNNDFKKFAPALEKMFDIARQEAEALGYKQHIYDALLDEYEEGATQAEARTMFDGLKGPLSALVKEIAAKPQVDDSMLYGDWDVSKGRAYTTKLSKAIGYDFNRGRQDEAPHPFCTNFSIGDVRITTRFKSYLPSSIFATLHETGHAMYEQGAPMEWDRLPLAGGTSLGVHESQSRLWENLVGRSLPFWKRHFGELAEVFPSLASLGAEGFYKAANKVEPSLIRVEADEVTYSLHVLIRFELECDILTGKLKIADLPSAWNAKYKDYLGIDVPSDAEGCLQDVHWSAGLIGYFPTYVIGNLLSHQIWTVMGADLGDLDALILKGDFPTIKNWLVEKIYSKGRMHPPKELEKMVTGSVVKADDFLNRMRAKYTPIYGL